MTPPLPGCSRHRLDYPDGHSVIHEANGTVVTVVKDAVEVAK